MGEESEVARSNPREPNSRSKSGGNMKIISIINYKGGVGKTTVTANLAAELAFRGRSVLAIDLDPQASLTFSFVSVDDWRCNPPQKPGH